jgi:endonuclease YncB( thermonuclease family)
MKVQLFTFLSLLLATAVAYADVTRRVVAVTDGDTIKVLDSDQVQHKVRLTGIDAPERAAVW